MVTLTKVAPVGISWHSDSQKVESATVVPSTSANSTQYGGEVVGLNVGAAVGVTGLQIAG